MNEGFPDFDLYEELEVSTNASPEVIQAAYRRLARKYHPDSSSEPDATRMVRLNAAFETLSKTEQRGSYDLWRAARGRTDTVAGLPDLNRDRHVGHPEQRSDKPALSHHQAARDRGSGRGL